MDELINKLTAFGIFLVIGLFMVVILLPQMYIGAYKIINKVDSSIFYRYSTNGKFDKNMFFSEKIEENTGILEQLENEISDFQNASRIQDFANIITKNQNKVKNIVLNNKAYQDYLMSIESSVDDMLDWSRKMAKLDDNIALVCLYIIFLLISFVMVVPFGFRTFFYLSAGTTYIFSMLSVFSDGVSDYLIANILSLLAKLTDDTFTYKDMEQWEIIFNQAFKESTLTFIIFDTVIQTYQNYNKEKIEKKFKYLYASLEIQCSYLKEIKNSSYVARLKVNVKDIQKYCKKNIKQYNKKINKKNILPSWKNSLIVWHSYYEKLEELLEFMENNNQEFTSKEYIAYLRKIQWLMYICCQTKLK